MADHFQDLYKTEAHQSSHYSVSRLAPPYDGMAALREFFPDGEVNELNFVLFSTSGVHGHYGTIEDAEARLNGDQDGTSDVTFLIVHPRVVHLRYGNVEPKTADDIAFLKKLRSGSWEVVQTIGRALLPPTSPTSEESGNG